MQVKKRDDGEEVSPFTGLQKSAVLHDAKIFNQSQLDARKCCQIITEILYLLNQGENFLSEEATEVFFGVTKLFQSQDSNLRRLVYLMIKSLNQNQDEAIIVISSLMKDVTGKVDLFRANAIRVLAKVIDPSMLGQMERFIKQGVVDKDPFIASAAIVAGLHLYPSNQDIIKRWVNEVQEAVTSPSKMVQFHALHLLHKIKQHDRRAIAKVVSGLTRKPPKSPLAQCLLIRYTFSVLGRDPPRQLIDFLQSCLHHKNSMVMYEAARALCSIHTDSLNESLVSPAISVLQEFLNSPIPAQRFAAVRTLSQIVTRFPIVVTPCSVDLEHLVTDPNRSIGTLAITTLLKTGVESSVERLMKSITAFMTDIPDELKIVVVDAIRTLCLKFPQKYESLMNFLSSVLREEGGFQYKKSIVDSMLILMNEIDKAKEIGLEHLCEFIEDCEFPDLSIQILHLLGDEGPKTSKPAKYIRFIFNRVILELPSVRSAAVSALAKFGTYCPSLTRNVCTLLRRCLNDNDDEVRDRATFYISILENQDLEQAQDFLIGEFDVPLADLEYSLQLYLEKETDTPFSLDQVVKDELAEEADHKRDSETGDAGGLSATPLPIEPEYPQLEAIPEFSELGVPFKSTKPIDLTESESEYLVSCVKHVYDSHVVLQFNITNTIDDQILENVNVELKYDEDWKEELVVSASVLPYDVPGNAFICVARPDDLFASDPMEATLKFVTKDASSADLDYEEGIEDEYELEQIEITVSDFLKPVPMNLVTFRSKWESIGNDNEHMKHYSLQMADLQEAVNGIVNLLGVAAVENSDVVPTGSRSHAINLSGDFSLSTGQIPVYVRAGFMLDPKHGVKLKIAARCPEQGVSNLICESIARA